MPQLITLIWSLRLKQFFRIRHVLGMARTLILMPLLIYVFLKVWLWPLEDPFIGASLLAGLIGYIHFTRKDYNFLRLAGYSPKKWMWVEYGGLILLGLVPSLGSARPLWGLLPLSLALLLPLVPPVQWSIKSGINWGRWIPAHLFEWKAGFNQKGTWLVLGWIAALGASPWPVSVPIFMVALPAIMADWYQVGQPLLLVQAFRRDAKGFLHTKLRLHLLAYATVCAPLLLAFLIQHPQLWYVVLYLGLMMAVLISLYICLFYSMFSPNESTPQASMLQIFAWICTFIPFFIPVPLIMLIQRYRRARQQLTLYLPAYAPV